MQVIFRVILMLAIICAGNVTAAKSLPVVGVMDFVSRVPITNLSDEQINTFQSAADYVMDELLAAPSCAEVITLTGEDTQALADEILIMSQIGKITPDIQMLASAEDCEYLLIGYIMNLSRTTGEKIIGKGDGIRTSLSVQVFDVATGKNVATFTGNGVSKSHIDRIGRIFRHGQLEFSEDNLNQAMEQAVHEIVTKIRKYI